MLVNGKPYRTIWEHPKNPRIVQVIDERWRPHRFPIEERSEREVKFVQGLYREEIVEILLTPPEAPAANYAFDVTPARLVTGLISERGICEASRESIANLFPDKLQIPS